MAQYIVKALKTYLKSPLTASATSLVVRKFVDSKGNELSLSDFGSWFVVVVKQGDTIEMIKCDGITQSGTDTSATLDVATNGRNLDPTTPYAGTSSGNAFQSGAEVIVTNDPLTVMQFGNLNNAQTWALLQTFTLAPVSSADAVASNELVRKSQLDSAVLGSLTNAPVVVPANAGETLAVDQLVYLKVSDREWYKADATTASTVENIILGITRGAGTDGNAITNGVTILGEHVAGSAIFTAGDVFASDTAGAFATSAGTKEVSLGVAYTTTKIYFSPRYSQQLTEDQQDALGGTSGTPSASNKFVTANDGNYKVPTGVLSPYAGASAPSGWLLTYGQDVSITTYEDLYDVIGTTYGAVSGGGTFTADAGTDFLTHNTHGYENGDVLILTTSGTLPAGLSLATKYYVINKTDNTFQLSATLGGSAIDITDTGTGTHTDNPNFAIPDLRGNFPLGKDNMGGSSRNRVTATEADTVGSEAGAETHTLTTDEIPAHTHDIYQNEDYICTNVTTKSAGGSRGTGTDHTAQTGSIGGGSAHNNMPPYMTLSYIIKT